MTITIANGSARTIADIALELQVPADNDRMELERLSAYFARLGGGFHKGATQVTGASSQINVDLSSGTLAASSGVVTLASVANNDTISINGVVFTAKTASPTGDQFLVGVSDTADAAAAVVAINASATAGIAGVVLASSALGVITLTSQVSGLIGNAISLASSNGTRLAVSGTATRDSVKYFTGGTGGSSASGPVSYSVS